MLVLLSIHRVDNRGHKLQQTLFDREVVYLH